MIIALVDAKSPFKISGLKRSLLFFMEKGEEMSLMEDFRSE